MSTYTETTLETGVLGTELYAGIVVTTLEIAQLDSSWLERTLFPVTDTAVITSSVTGDLSKAVTERGTLSSSTSATKRFTIVTTETAKLSSSVRGKNIVYGDILLEEAVVASALVLTAALRREITETGKLSSNTRLTKRITATLTEVARLKSFVLEKSTFVSEETGALASSSTTGRRGRTIALGAGRLSSEVLSRLVQRTSLRSRGNLEDTVHGRRTTRHTLTDRLYGGRNVRTFRP